MARNRKHAEITGVMEYATITDAPPASEIGASIIYVQDIKAHYKTNGTHWIGDGYSDLIADRPSAAVFGRGNWQVGNVIYSSDGVSYVVNKLYLSSENSVSAATRNTSLIQAALNVGGEINLSGVGDCYINDTLLIADNTNFKVENGLNIRLYPGTAKNMMVNSSYLAAGTSVTMSWSAGEVASVAWTGHGKSVGDYVWLSGADQAQFRGVFHVKTVTDANNIIVSLERTPTTTATGTIIARTPNKNIIIDISGKFNYDRTNNIPTTGSLKHAIILSGVVNLNIVRATINNALKYCLNIAALRDARVNNIRSEITNSDLVKVYGPVFGLVIDGVYGYAGDDVISLQGKEPPAFSAYDISNGDIIGVELKNIRPSRTSSSTSTVNIYASVSEIIDNIVIDGVDVINRCKVTMGDGLTACSLGKIHFKNIKIRENTSTLNPLLVDINGTVDMIVFESLDGGVSNTGASGMVYVSSTATIDTLVIKSGRHKSSGTGNPLLLNFGIINKLVISEISLQHNTAGTGGAGYALLVNSGTIKGAIVSKNSFRSSATNAGRIILNNSTITSIVFSENSVYGFEHMINNISASNAGMLIVVKDNSFDSCYGVLNLAQSAVITLLNNIRGAVGTYGLLRVNGAGLTFKVTSSGNVATGAWLVLVGGSEVVSLRGTDLPIALSSLTRTVPGQIVTAIGAIGTIVAGEVAINDTTNTTSSWKQLTNTSLVY